MMEKIQLQGFGFTVTGSNVMLPSTHTQSGTQQKVLLYIFAEVTFLNLRADKGVNEI